MVSTYLSRSKTVMMLTVELQFPCGLGRIQGLLPCYPYPPKNTLPPRSISLEVITH
jgi:hypothetical protein